MRCPHCDEPVPRGARACPSCGSDDRTGWASDEDRDHADVEIPDGYDPARWDRWEKEAGTREVREGHNRVVVGLIVLALLLPLILGLRALLGSR